MEKIIINKSAIYWEFGIFFINLSFYSFIIMRYRISYILYISNNIFII